MPSPLSPKYSDEQELFARYCQHGDQNAREALVSRFLPLARSLARRYHRGGENQEDLNQVATIGLINAVDRFDPDRAIAFSSFAVPTILGELKRYFRDKSWAVRVPRELQETVLKIDSQMEELFRKLGRSPTPHELSTQLGISLDQVLEALEAAGAYRTTSLDQPAAEEGTSGIASYAERVGGDDPGFEQAEYHVTLEHLLDALTEREREVLQLRFYSDLSQAEIADHMECSQMHVSRMIRDSLSRLSILARAPFAE